MKIIAIGRNYINHAKELNNPLPEKPIFFIKPETSLLRNNQSFYYPDFSSNIHYEVEMVVKISKVGKNIDRKFANRYYEEIGIGIDFTARDLQDECKKKGLPWEIAKGFDFSAPLGNSFINKTNFDDIQNINFSLQKNENVVQIGNTKNMIFPIDVLIEYVSRFMTLKIGDLIFTGTPEGVGPINIGDRLIAKIENQIMLDFEIK